MNSATLTRPDGRTAGFCDFGPRGAKPVIWCHGGPGCRREPEYFAPAAVAAGFRLIGIDRPGYGLSTPQPGRTIGGWVDDALAVADRLGVHEFATVGVSTGGAHALARAASTRRVIGTVACCALTDMRWPEGRPWLPACEEIWSAPSRDAALAIVETQFGAHGERVGSRDAIPLAPSEERLFADPVWRRLWSEHVREWFVQGAAGYADDRLADRSGWHTFDVTRIACPVTVLQGTSDTLVPVTQARYTQRIVPGATLELRDGRGRGNLIGEVVPTLSALLGPGRGTARRASAS